MVLPFSNPHLLLMDVDAKRLEHMDSTLRGFGYQVTKCLGFGKIFEMLFGEKDSILLCVSSLQPPYGEDEFQVTRFCQQLSIPIVLTCCEWNGELLLKSILSGALDLLIQPLSNHVLQYIWKYMFWKRQDGINLTRTLIHNSIISSAGGSLTINKGSRTVWSPELRKKFLEAYEYCLPGGISPAKITQHMKVPGLTPKRVGRYLKLHLASIKQKEVLENEVSRSARETSNIVNTPLALPASDDQPSNIVNNPLALPASDDQPSNNLVNTPPPSFDAHQSSHGIIQGVQQNSLRENDGGDWMGLLLSNTESSGMDDITLWYDDGLGLLVGNDSLDNTLNDGSATQTDEHVQGRDDPMEESERDGLV